MKYNLGKIFLIFVSISCIIVFNDISTKAGVYLPIHPDGVYYDKMLGSKFIRHFEYLVDENPEVNSNNMYDVIYFTDFGYSLQEIKSIKGADGSTIVKTLVVIIELEIKEIDAGYQGIGIYKDHSTTDTLSQPITNYEYYGGTVKTTYSQVVFYTEVSLIDLNKGYFIIRYNASGNDSDRWVNRNLKVKMAVATQNRKIFNVRELTNYSIQTSENTITNLNPDSIKGEWIHRTSDLFVYQNTLGIESYDVINIVNVTGMNTNAMINQGYKTLLFCFYIDIAEVDDGYQEIYVYDGGRTKLLTTPLLVFEHTSGAKNGNYVTYELYFEIELRNIEFNTFVIGYSSHGNDADTWKNRNIMCQISVSTQQRKVKNVVVINNN